MTAESGTTIHLRAGLPVMHGDVVPYAKRRCRMCAGTGEVRLVQGYDVEHKTPEGPIRVDAPRVAKVCGCALVRFTKARSGLLVMRNGRLYWLEGSEPAEAYARRIEEQKNATG